MYALITNKWGSTSSFVCNEGTAKFTAYDVILKKIFIDPVNSVTRFINDVGIFHYVDQSGLRRICTCLKGEYVR